MLKQVLVSAAITFGVLVVVGRVPALRKVAGF